MPTEHGAPITSAQYAALPGGVSLHYASAGVRGAPLMLLLHGFPEFWYAWRALLSHFGQHYYAVAPDLRGYNLSSKPVGTDSYRIGALIGDVEALIESLGYRDTVLVAHDWGGALAWSFAIARPNRLSRLVVMNAPHPVPFARALAGDPAQQAASQYMNMLRRPGSETALAADDFAPMLAFFRGISNADWLDAPTIAAYRTAWSQPGALAASINWYRASPLYPPCGDDPGAARIVLDPRQFIVNTPTLLLWGEQDKALLPVLLEDIESVVPRLRLQRLADASHWLVHERPDAICAAIDDFLAGKA